MMNKKERMEKLNNAGVDTGKYFSIDIPQGLKPGAKIQLIINDKGRPMVICDDHDRNTVLGNDPIIEQIITDGYVRNTKLHRRFVMAQMFQMLNYKSYDGMYEGYTDCLHKQYGYQYTFDMMLEEIRVLSRLESRDRESFEERRHFFTRDVVIDVVDDYMDKLKKYVDKLPTKKCKGTPYKRVKGIDIFIDDLEKKLYRPLRNSGVHKLQFATNYTEMYKYLRDFMSKMIKLPYETPKSKAWIDAFKGEGAYYTLKNLFMYHGCYVEHECGIKLYGAKAVGFIDSKLDEYQDEGWRMFALMKKVIKDNDFDFNKRMSEIYIE